MAGIAGGSQAVRKTVMWLGGVDDFLYSYGLSFLPLSTATLLMSTQLGFTVVFSFFIVKQKLNAFTVNAVVLLTFGIVILGVRANNDLLDGEAKQRYYLGFIMTLGAAIIYSMVLPLVELIYIRTKQEMSHELVIEMQFFMGLFASIFCAFGMAFNKDFQAISRESELYGLGKAEYYLVVLFTTVTGQFFFLGTVGTIKYSSALLCGVIIAVCIPITEVFALIFFHEKFDGVKGVALALSLWGTASYFYGEYKEHNKSNVYAMESQHLPL
ncbi:purine permease 3-like [Phalaenopsis equestris]|uniref:purine permease 3-like n=1 Tax=Phalaenopsis equestris TaxID=78828 RepID=UPI0009E46C90|nr:purine permease 3-like [Phalaenopsis equestris]